MTGSWYILLLGFPCRDRICHCFTQYKVVKGVLNINVDTILKNNIKRVQ